MRSRVPLFASLLVVGSFVLPLAVHAQAVTIPFFGPIIPDAYATCPLNWHEVIDVINRIITFALTFVIVFLAPIMIAYAGFLYVVNSVNPSGKERAKKMLWNIVMGVVIALAAWMIVDAIMAALYDKAFGTWSSIVNWGGDPCLPQAGSAAGAQLNQAAGPPGITTGVPSTGPSITTVGPSGQAITVSFAQTQSNASLQAGYTAASMYSAQIASACSGSTIPNCTTVMTSLIAAESGGNPTTGCNASNACGIMQLTTANGGTACAVTDTVCIGAQITKGVQLFQQGYNSFPNIPNALAAYNSGITTQAGQSASGLNSAMVASVNCPGYYAWQCSINPGGLVETQSYVANICQNITSHGGTCN